MRVPTGKPDEIAFKIQRHDIEQFRREYKTLPEYCLVKITKPKKSRTTGEKSQNHHINGHVQQMTEYAKKAAKMCIYSQMDFEDIKSLAKERAIKRGYPVDVLSNGWIIPRSETQISTIEAGYLIDELHQIADEMGWELTEE